jgi:tetratricopeptide (TPR) repeat protein
MIRYLRFRSAYRPAILILVVLLITAGGCGSSRVVHKGSGVDENLARLNRSARIAFDNGQLEQAANQYRQALNRAYLRDDRKAVVDAQYNLAVCMLGLRSYDKALERVHQAQNELVRNEESVTADILLLKATILYRTGKLEDAWQITDQILLPPNQPAEAVESKTHFLRGLIADKRGDTNQLRKEINALNSFADSGLKADREELSGRLAMAENNWDAAIQAFDSTARQRREKLDYRKMVQALALAAEACDRAGKPSDASKRYFRAGRSAALQGNHQDAVQWLERAAQLAGQAGDEPLKQEVRSYLKSMQTP